MYTKISSRFSGDANPKERSLVGTFARFSGRESEFKKSWQHTNHTFHPTILSTGLDVPSRPRENFLNSHQISA
jgi:hypothetical protein